MIKCSRKEYRALGVAKRESGAEFFFINPHSLREMFKVEQGVEQPGLVKGVPSHGRG